MICMRDSDDAEFACSPCTDCMDEEALTHIRVPRHGEHTI
jgi:hypothetical protein